MSTIASAMPAPPIGESAWIPPRLYRMSVEQYEAMAASGAIPKVEVFTGPGPRGYGPAEAFTEGQSVPVVIDGREVGRIAVADILPSPRAGTTGEGEGA